MGATALPRVQAEAVRVRRSALGQAGHALVFEHVDLAREHLHEAGMTLSSAPCSFTVVGARASWKTGAATRHFEV